MTTVHPVRRINSSNQDPTQTDIKRELVSVAIEAEKEDHEIKSHERIQIFKDILSNKPRESSTFKYPCYGLSSIVIALVTLPVL
jgi:hypothetical protein